jgi:hypothetical protein
MSKPEAAYRRPLNTEQLAVLELLFKFRFATNEQLAKYFGKQTGKAIQKRLTILCAQGYIARHYNGSYRLHGKPAEYYLLPKGVRLLRTKQSDITTITDQAIKNLYKDKTASPSFTAHSITILTLHLKLVELYGDRLKSFTKTQLNIEAYHYFIRPLPDTFLSIRGGTKDTGKPKRFFLDFFEDNIPFFVLIRRIKKYLMYLEEDDWPTDTFPTILMVTESTRRQKQLTRRIAKELREADMDEDDIVFATTTKELLLQAISGKDKVWQVIDEDKTMKAMTRIV